MTIHELDTPALLIDLDRLERNLDRVAAYCREHGLRLRPHTKTHKNPAIGRMQLDRGAAGLTVAKVGEAEVMLSTGTPDLLVAYPIIGESKLRRLMEVAGKTRVTVALDSLDAAQGLSQAATASGRTIGVLIEVNLGLNRCGLDPGPALVDLARSVNQLPGLSLEGIEFYYGQVRFQLESGEEAFRKVQAQAAQVQEDFVRAGIDLRIVSGGTTPTLWRSHEVPSMNEVRPGTYVFFDAMQVQAGACGWDDCAVTIMTTVVSNARDGFAIIDGGSKTFTSDRLSDGPATFGRVTELPGALFYSMNEEHGYLDVRPTGRKPAIGERLRIIPNHVCVAVNMHETVYGIRGEQVEHVWRVEGRGKLQ